MRNLRVFISHYNGDNDIANKIKNAVSIAFGQGHQIFLSSDLPAGDDWFKSITEFLNEEGDLITIVVTSKASLDRSWVWFEVGASWRTGAYVIPLCCKGFDVKSLPDPLSRLNGVNFNRKGIEKMIDAIGQRINNVPDHSVVKLAANKVI